MADELFSRWLAVFHAAATDAQMLRSKIDHFNALYKKATFGDQGDFHHLAATFTSGRG